MSVTNLTVHKNTIAKRQRREVWNRLVGAAKSIPKDIDGMALVAYRRNNDELEVIADYSVRDPADTAILPHLFAKYLERLT